MNLDLFKKVCVNFDGNQSINDNENVIANEIYIRLENIS